MNYIRTRCPNGCKYKIGYTCTVSECPYQTGNVIYDIRMNAEEKKNKINAQVKKAVKEFAYKLKDNINGIYIPTLYKEKEFEIINKLINEYDK